jgi:hypothetical protein
MAPIQAFRIPSPNILYRIESVEFISYLELYDIDDQKVFLRPLRDSSNQQARSHQVTKSLFWLNYDIRLVDICYFWRERF